MSAPTKIRSFGGDWIPISAKRTLGSRDIDVSRFVDSDLAILALNVDPHIGMRFHLNVTEIRAVAQALLDAASDIETRPAIVIGAAA